MASLGDEKMVRGSSFTNINIASNIINNSNGSEGQEQHEEGGELSHSPALLTNEHELEHESENEHDQITVFSDDENHVKLFIGQIPKNLDEESLRPFFEEFGPIIEFSVIRDKATRLHKGCAFVTYASQQSAIHAIQSLHDKVKLPQAQNPLQIRPAESIVEKENKVFVGMLPKTVTELDLQEMFSPYGQLKEIHIIRGPDGNSKGCAFVKFVGQESALLAIQHLNDTIPEGSARPLVIKMADSKRSSRDGFDDASSTASGADVRDYWMAPHSSSSSFPPPDHSTNPSSPAGQYAMPHSMMSQNPYLSYPHSAAGAPSPHMQPAAPSYMFYHGFYSHDGPNSPASPPSNMGLMSMSPSGPVMYQLPAPSMGSPSFQMPPDQRQAPGGSGFPASRAVEKAESSVRQAEGPVGANLFIYHLPRDLTDADLATLFAPFGEVISAKVFMDKKTAESKGFGFVSFNSVSAAEAAINSMNGFQIGSKRLKVQHKRVGGYPEPMAVPMSYAPPSRGSPGSRSDASGGCYPSGVPISMGMSPYGYQQSPYLAINMSGAATTDSLYSQHHLGMAQSPPMGMAYMQSPYGSQPIPAQYLAYAPGEDPQRRMAAAAHGYPPPPPMYLSSPPSSRPSYYGGGGHSYGYGYAQGQGQSSPYDPSEAHHLSQAFDHSLRLNPDGSGGAG